MKANGLPKNSKINEFCQFIRDYNDSPEAQAMLENFLNTPDINIDSFDTFGGSPLHIACKKGYEPVVLKLLDKGADINLASDFFGTPLHTACQFAQHRIVEILLNHGADVNVVNNDEDKVSPLHIACQKGQVNIAAQLLAHGAEIEAVEGNGFPPLFLATLEGKVDVIALLISYGAELDGANAASPSILFGDTSKEIVKCYLAAGRTIPPKYIEEIQKFFPGATFTPDPHHEGHFILTASNPMAHVNAVNQQFTESLPALLGDIISPETVLPQLITAMYEAEFVKALQKNFGENVKVPVAPWQRQVFEEQALTLAGNFMTIQTFTPSLDTPPASAASEEEKWQATVSGGKTPISLFPKPRGQVPSLQKFAAKSLATALVKDEVALPEIKGKEKYGIDGEKEEGQESLGHSHVGNIQKERNNEGKHKRCVLM